MGSVVSSGSGTPELTDGVIVLAALTSEDVPALVAGEDDEFVARLSGGPSTPATAQRYVDACAADWRGDWYRGGVGLSWGIRDAATSRLAGTAEIQLRFSELEVGAANLSYGVFPEWRGRRYAGRAVELMCEFLTTRTTASLAVLRIDRDNAASLRVAEGCGFRPSPQLAPRGASMRWFARTLRS